MERKDEDEEVLIMDGGEEEGSGPKGETMGCSETARNDVLGGQLTRHSYKRFALHGGIVATGY